MANASCIFCQILDGEIPSRTVYEAEAARAFLDVNPLSPGHTLVVPRAHRERLQDLDESEAAGLWGTVQAVLPAVEDAVDADATTVGVNNGAASGQEVPHVHVHVVPRFDGDGGGPIHVVAGERPSLTESDLDDIATAISSNVTPD
ncbi:MAG: HIT family protein [Halobacteriota archaeon]